MLAQQLQSAYSGGVVRDLPRHMLPAGSVWSLIDFIANLDGAPLQKRGGWKADAAFAGANSINAIAYTPFSGTDVYVALDDHGHLWQGPVSYDSLVLAAAPALYWRLNEAPGVTAAVDSSLHGNDGTYDSGCTLGQPGLVDSDTSVLLNNTTSGEIYRVAYQPYTANSKRTFIGVAKRNATTDVDTLIAGTGTLATPPRLYINSGGEDVIWSSGGGSSVTWAAAWPATGVAVRWALTYDDSTKIAELFINGVSKGTRTLAGSYVAVTGGFRAGVWSQSGANHDPFNGTVAKVAVFESILPSATISAIHGATTTWTDKGACTITRQRPIFFSGKLIMLPDGAVFTTPKKYDGTTISSMGMTGLTGVTPKWGVTYKSRLVIADSTTLYFSNALDPETYDVDSFVKATKPIVGLAALPNMIAIFSSGGVERLRGTTPPSSTSAGDMALEPAFAEGCVDARSIVVYQDQMIWANTNGVHISDGAAITNLVEVGGIVEYWHSIMESYSTNAGWTFAGGIFKNRYILSITDGNGNFIAGFARDLSKKTWSFLSNLPVKMFTESLGATPELVMALSTHNYVGYFSPCFDPSSSDSDGDGTAVQPQIEFPFYRMGTGKSRWRDIFLGVDLLDVGAEAASLQVWYTTDPDSSSYTQLVDDAGNPITIGSTNGYELHRLPVHVASNGIGLKVVQVGASAHTILFELEAEIRGLEGRF